MSPDLKNMGVGTPFPLIVGHIRFVIRDDMGHVVDTFTRRNAITPVIYRRLAWAIGSANTTADVRCTAIDFHDSGGLWYTGGGLSLSGGTGDGIETHAVHVETYTADASRIIDQLRLRERLTAFDTNTDGNAYASLTGLSINLQTTWQLEARWRLSFLAG
jgi:hypothetical protein